MEVNFIVKGRHNKRFVRDFFIDCNTLGLRFHDSL